jgi:5'-nucleotidase
MSPSRFTARVTAGTVGLALAATGLTFAGTSAAHAADGDDVVINLVGINDFHGRINSNTVKWAGTVEQVKARGTADNTLFVGAGDLVGASEFASATAEDQPTIDVLNELGLDASSVGNHEFDKGWSDLDGRIIDGGANAAWEYLAANVYAKGTTDPVLPEYWPTTVGGLKVAVIGAVTEETSTLVSPAGIADLDFGPIVPALNRVADELTDGDTANGEADIIVATVHAGAIKGAGSTYEEQVAQNGEFRDMALNLSPKINAVFQGHTHQVYAWDAPVTGGDLATRPLLQTGNYGSNVGNIQLTVDPTSKRVVSYTKENVAQVTTADADLIASYPVLADVKTTVDDALAAAAVVGNQPVGSITGDITTALPDPASPVTLPPGTNRDDRTNESTLGDLIGNAMRDGVPADMGDPDIGVANSGGLRSELIYAGDTSSNPENTDGVVTYAEANNVLPFVNNVWLGQITGASFKKVLEEQWQPEGTSRPKMPLGLSDNVQVTYDESQPRYSKVTSVRINGEPLDPARTYTVSTFNFLSTGGDNFTSFTEATWADTGLVDRDLWIGYLRSNPGLSPDFARQQVGVTGTPVAGTTSRIGLSKLDLTSAASPANTSVTVTGRDTEGYEEDLGTYPVAGGAMKRLIDIPAELAGGSLTFLAEPTMTTATIPVLTTSSLKVTAPTVNPGNRGKVTVSVSAVGGVVPTGTVTISNAGTRLGSGTLSHGAATITLGTTALAPGSHTLTATYSGDAVVGGSGTSFVLRVNKAAARVTVGKPTRVVRNKTRAVLRVRVTGFHGKAASGSVTARVGGKRFTATLVNGVARVRLARFKHAGKKTVVISYAGDGQTLAGTRTARLTVKKRK